MGGHSTRYAIGTLLFLLSGPIAWAVHFGTLYAVQSSMCALDIGETAGGHNATVVLIIVALTLLFGALTAAAALWPRGWHAVLAGGPLPDDEAGPLLAMTRLLCALAGVAMLYAGAASLVLPACAQLR